VLIKKTKKDAKYVILVDGDINDSEYSQYYSLLIEGAQKPPSNEVPLVSAKGVDYRKLRDLLKAKKWKEADEETRVKILKVANRESEGWLRVEDAKNFSCQDLGTIDKLWVKYSNGKFGFSVQKQIYQGVGGTINLSSDDWKKFREKVGLSSDDWKKFGEKVGWRRGGEWGDYGKEWFYSEEFFNFSEKHYTAKGHLPYTNYWEVVGLLESYTVDGEYESGSGLALMWRPVDCNI
jgi:hypothetical protein